MTATPSVPPSRCTALSSPAAEPVSQVAPAHLDTVATAPAGHEELAVAAATTGPTNLVAHAVCRDAEALHQYLERRVAWDAVTRIETAPVLRTYEAAAALRRPPSPEPRADPVAKVRVSLSAVRPCV
ncbi:Lrp/AsnC ligand binding domain-containing protein [Streptomyces sp. NPDC006446]|uniref:Lrp/AsnC ligand binding domain-containing protein n=1 Tax=Streptomyces sp. NPDC006446 TaxID=3154301 RepID=UPI0033A62CF1